MLTHAVRILRCLGWLVLAGSVGVVACVTLSQAAGGPDAGQDIWPSPRMWRYFCNTLWMAASATAFALVLALPAAVALVLARRAWQRRILHSLTILPLITMPSIFAYAWLLLATSREGAVAGLLQRLGWTTDGAGHVQAGWVLATWLWPIPALIVATSFKHIGSGAYRLACLDASPTWAFVRGALPAMRGPIVAAAAIVFVLAATDTTIPPLVFANDTWGPEMIAVARAAGGFERPIAYLAWHAWPILVTVALLAAAAMPGLRQMSRWADNADVGDTGAETPTSGWIWAVACLITLLIAVFPLVVFSTEFVAVRGTPSETLQTAYRTCRNAALATLIVAALAVGLSVLLALAALDEPNWPRPWRIGPAALVLLVVAVAILPAALTGTALVAFFSSERISPRGVWNVYDNTPLVWTAAMVARFSFLPVCLARVLNKRVPQDVVAQATSDGAGRIDRLVHVHLPVLWRPMVAAGMMTACLTLSESVASELVQPPQFFGGSLAFHIDHQMHYGRQDETVALSLMLMTPAILAALAAPLLLNLPALRRAPTRRQA